MTKFVKKSEINCKWYEIDAKNAVVGRLATIITKIIRGKNSPKFSPHMDHGDFVVVKNIEHIKFTGNKFENKKYYRHTGYPGGQRSINASSMLLKFPERLIEKAVKGMLPKNKLGNQLYRNLYVYVGSEHDKSAQKPKKVELN